MPCSSSHPGTPPSPAFPLSLLSKLLLAALPGPGPGFAGRAGVCTALVGELLLGLEACLACTTPARLKARWWCWG